MIVNLERRIKTPHPRTQAQSEAIKRIVGFPGVAKVEESTYRVLRKGDLVSCLTVTTGEGKEKKSYLDVLLISPKGTWVRAESSIMLSNSETKEAKEVVGLRWKGFGTHIEVIVLLKENGIVKESEIIKLMV